MRIMLIWRYSRAQNNYDVGHGRNVAPGKIVKKYKRKPLNDPGKFVKKFCTNQLNDFVRKLNIFLALGKKCKILWININMA